MVLGAEIEECCWSDDETKKSMAGYCSVTGKDAKRICVRKCLSSFFQMQAILLTEGEVTRKALSRLANDSE